METTVSAVSPQALQDSFMKSLHANDPEGLAACYAPDAVNFTVDALIGVGPESARSSWERFFSAYRVRKAWLHEDHLEIHGDTAIAWGLFTIVVEPVDDGDGFEMTGRYMDVARKLGDGWLYVADHASVPIRAE